MLEMIVEVGQCQLAKLVNSTLCVYDASIVIHACSVEWTCMQPVEPWLPSLYMEFTIAKASYESDSKMVCRWGEVTDLIDVGTNGGEDAGSVNCKREVELRGNGLWERMGTAVCMDGMGRERHLMFCRLCREGGKKLLSLA